MSLRDGAGPDDHYARELLGGNGILNHIGDVNLVLTPGRQKYIDLPWKINGGR